MKRKTCKPLCLILAAALVLSLLAPAALAAEDPNTIYLRTEEDLAELARNCALDRWSRGKTVRLEADLDLAGMEFTPIPTFGGTFEGQGHTISGLSITGSGNVRGLFRYIQPTGAVRDLTVEGSLNPSDRKNTLGGLAGENRGVLTNCAFLNILDKAFHNLKVHVRFKKGHPDFPQRGFYVVLRKSSLATQVPEYILKFLR